jgi:hypothetical protein
MENATLSERGCGFVPDIVILSQDSPSAIKQASYKLCIYFIFEVKTSSGAPHTFYSRAVN